MTTTVNYSKRFTTGNLKRLTVECHIDCVDVESAYALKAQMPVGSKGQDIITNDQWKIG